MSDQEQFEDREIIPDPEDLTPQELAEEVTEVRRKKRVVIIILLLAFVLVMSVGVFLYQQVNANTCEGITQRWTQLEKNKTMAMDTAHRLLEALEKDYDTKGFPKPELAKQVQEGLAQVKEVELGEIPKCTQRAALEQAREQLNKAEPIYGNFITKTSDLERELSAYRGGMSCKISVNQEIDAVVAMKLAGERAKPVVAKAKEDLDKSKDSTLNAEDLAKQVGDKKAVIADLEQRLAQVDKLKAEVECQSYEDSSKLKRNAQMLQEEAKKIADLTAELQK